MSGGVHHDEVLQDLIDGRLSAEVEQEVRAHLASCGRCHAELQRLEAGRAAAVSLRRDRMLPTGLASSISDALDEEDRRSGRLESGSSKPRETRWPDAWQWASIAAAALVIVAAALWWMRPVDIPAQAVRDFESVIAGVTRLDVRTSDPSELEAYFARTIEPRIRVIDLAMMGFVLEGGRQHTLGSRPSALYLYRGAGGDRLVCQMFAGSAEDLPATDDVRENGGFQFHIVRQGNVTLVFWLEGDVVCVLISRNPTDEVVKLAFAKAMRPS